MSLKPTVFFISVLLLSSCVSQRQFEEATQRETAAQKALSDCKSSLEARNDQLAKTDKEVIGKNEEIRDLEKETRNLEEDTLVAGRRYKRLKNEYKDLTDALEKQIAVNREMAVNSEQKNKRLYSELLALEKELQEKEAKLNERDDNLTRMQSDLVTREKRVTELQSIISEKDSMMNSLKETLTKALLNFKDKGISVKVEDDKVYVSLEEQILFPSGKYKIDKKVKTALVDLGNVLNANPDIAIMVEGHTDSDPIKSNCISDNYDLSVLRSTEIVRVLTQDGKVDPKRVVAAGRGEYSPVAPNTTSEGKRKNRRIEIILTPNLDKLYNLLNEQPE